MRGETACVRTPNYVLTVGHALRRRSQFHTHDAECCNFCDLKTSSDSLFAFFLYSPIAVGFDQQPSLFALR